MIENINQFEKKIYSQRGEDGIIEVIVSSLGIKNGWCCEFGAWDGIHLSNVYNLINNHNWNAVLIEGDQNKFKELEWNMRYKENVYCNNNYVSLEPEGKLNKILSKYEIPCDFDLLSIDIDSYDYWVWASLTYNPKIVIIEYNSSFEEAVTLPYEYPPKPCDYGEYFGASASALVKLGNTKGYELIGLIPYNNLIFIRKGLNRNLFKKINLSEIEYISKSHKYPLTKEQEIKLIFNPPNRWEEV